MVRALALTARGVGSSPTRHYTFLCFGLFGDNIIINTMKKNENRLTDSNKYAYKHKPMLSSIRQGTLQNKISTIGNVEQWYLLFVTM